MSQDQATKSKVAKQESVQSVNTNHSIHDPLAREEIRTSFQEDSAADGQHKELTKDTSAFRLGLAQAFAQEEDMQEDFTYAPPPGLAKVHEFMSNFDFSDRNNPTHRFALVSNVYSDILNIQAVMREMNGQSALSFQARQQLQEDLYLLDTYQRQASDFMEETRPTY